MGPRILWLVLVPTLAGAGFMNYINVGFTCEGAYGDDESDETCSRIGEDTLFELLLFGGWAPLAVLLFGAFLWPTPRALSWFTGAVVLLAGIVLVGISLLISTEGVAAVFAIPWVLAAMVAGTVILGERAVGSTSCRCRSAGC